MAYLNHLQLSKVKKDGKIVLVLTCFMQLCSRKQEGQRWHSKMQTGSPEGDSGIFCTEAQTSGNQRGHYSSLKFHMTKSTCKANNSIQKWKETVHLAPVAAWFPLLLTDGRKRLWISDLHSGPLKEAISRTSLVVQCLRLCTPGAGGPWVQYLVRELDPTRCDSRSHKSSHAATKTRHSQINKLKRRTKRKETTGK